MTTVIYIIVLTAFSFLGGLIVGITYLTNLYPAIFTNDLSKNISILSDTAVAITLAFLWLQIREATKVARLDANREASLAVDNVLKIFIEEPELRPYFYSNKTPPKHDSIIKRKIETMAELLTDNIGVVCRTDATLKYSKLDSLCWDDYIQFLIDHSPAICDILKEHEYWNHEIHQRLARRNIKLPKSGGA